MKKKSSKVLILALLLSAGLLSGCYASAGTHATGMLHSEMKGPLMVAEQDVQPMKKGTATCTSYLGLTATGDCSIEAAMKNGDITKIHHVDYRNNTILIKAEFTTIVYGE